MPISEPTAPPGSTRIAYFSMGIGLDTGMPTYAGGLGILTGDTLRAAWVLFSSSSMPWPDRDLGWLQIGGLV
jgi:hypothetical protein